MSLWIVVMSLTLLVWSGLSSVTQNKLKLYKYILIFFSYFLPLFLDLPVITHSLRGPLYYNPPTSLNTPPIDINIIKYIGLIWPLATLLSGYCILYTIGHPPHNI